MKVYAYLRVSSKGQAADDRDGYTRQIAAIESYAEKNGLEIAEVFQEQISGTKEERPELARLLVTLESNGTGIDTVIIEKADRLARSLMTQEMIICDFKRGGFKLISATEGNLIEDHALLDEDPSRKLIRQVMGSFAEYDRAMTVMKLRAARDRKRAKGEKCEGAPSYKEVAPEIITEIKRLRRKHKGSARRMTYQEIADQLNKSSKTTLRGKPWSATSVRDTLVSDPKWGGKANE